jgi:hypothetical protein
VVPGITMDNWVSMSSAGHKGFLTDEFTKHGTCLQVSSGAKCDKSLMHPMFDVGEDPDNPEQPPAGIPRIDLERAYYTTTVELFNAFFRGADNLDDALRGLDFDPDEVLTKKKQATKYSASVIGERQVALRIFTSWHCVVSWAWFHP